MGSLFKKPKVNTAASGFFSMPKQYQDLYTGVLGNANTLLPNIDPNMFQMSSGNTAGAFGDIMQGFTPTAQSIGADMSMLMGNPYNENVINMINREAQGQNSLVNQAANQAGQMGSNRSFLASSDVEQSRLNNIGQFQQQQYNTALSQILNNLVPQRQADAANALNVGMQDRQAPIEALMAQLGLLGGFPTSFGTQGQAQSSGGGTDIGKIASTVGSIAGLFSDRRLKENIAEVGEVNGHKTYRFNYKGDEDTYIGVMADEVERVNPEAVSDINGYKAVDYDMIGVPMLKVL